MFEKLHLRRQLVHEIQKLKASNEAFDPQRERALFLELKDELATLDLKELLSFSLLMESHVLSSGKKYPDWSGREHLEVSQGTICEMVNPILLAVVKPDLFKNIRLSASFKDILNFS